VMVGDQPGTFDGMRLVLSGMQSLALSGQSVSAHNLGGYAGRQDPSVYLRWTQLGVFSPLYIIWNSGPTGEPWTFDDETVNRYRDIAAMRMQILPYLYSGLCEYGENGIPLIRPMVLAAPDDPDAAVYEDQFLCGSELLVAPVFTPTGDASVYLPAGDWLDFWTGEAVTGGREIQVNHPIETFPIYVRRGGLVPMEQSPLSSADSVGAEIDVHVYGVGANRFRLHEAGRITELTVSPQRGGLELFSGPVARPGLVWRLHGMPAPRAARFEGPGGAGFTPDVREDGAVWSIRVPAGGGRLMVET